MAQSTSSVFRYVGQAILYALFGAFIVYFSTSPTYHHMDPDEGC